MNTSSTKTRALCVATRCTSVEQFVATFHRFCGDDETFFVATMTSRPIGLETPFSIQLADKQPVLRGMCIVLDAWETPENRYRRPGIRLGIKRLTADSQVVFDRLKAASRVPANVEATPPPGPAPLPSIASGSRPSIARRGTATPPPLPPLLAPRAAPPPLPPLAEARRPLPSVPPATAKPALAVVTVPPLPADAKRMTPPAIDAPRVTPPAIDAPRVTPPAIDAPRVTPPAIDAQPPVRPTPPPLDAQPPTRPTPPSPIAVTRFQVALHVDTIPPPLSDVEFKPQELIPRKRAEPRIVSEPAPGDTPVDEAQPALIVDRRGAPVDPAAPAPANAPIARPDVPPPEPLPPEPPAEPVVRPREPELAEPRDTTPMLAAPDVFGRSELRTPGSALVLPANPLQDLSDESIEGFIDCTLYEETENIFHPAVDGPEWEDPTAESLLMPPDPASTVPAMPFDAAPNLTVRASGESESLTVADDPALSRTASGELVGGGGGGGMVAEPVDDDAPSQPPPDAPAERASVEITDEALAQSRTMSGELWSETVRRRTPPTGTPRLQPRPDTPLPRPATNVPLDLGEAPDPASWFDSVSLPYGAPGAPAPQAPAVTEYLGPRPATPPGAYDIPPPGAYDIPPPGSLEPVAPHAMPPSGPVEPAMLHHAPMPGSYVTPPGIPLDPSQLSAYPVAPEHPHHSTADVVMLPPPGIRPPPPWQRWLLIGGSAFIAIMIAFGIARMVRGGSRLAVIAPLATAGAPSHAAPAAPSHAAPPPAPPPAATPASAAPPRSAQGPTAAPAAAPAAGSNEPADPADSGAAADPVADDDGEAAARGAPVVGSGPCRFTVATTPAGSIIRLDDQAMGPSPITIEGSCDKHKIDISHARYQSVTRWLTLAADQPQSLDISLPRPIHAITITSFPPGAELSIDGHRAGTTPTVLQMTGFATVNLTFTKPGFQTVTRKVYSKVAQDRVFVKLMK